MESVTAVDPELWTSEQLVLGRDAQLGLHAVIAIDDTALGPGLGDVRSRRYPDDAAAIRAKVTEIYEGTSEIRRLVTARALLGLAAREPLAKIAGTSR